MKISILLSTYNGELYLKEQIDSLLAQTMNDWFLFIRDDGSTDNTNQIINEYIREFPSKINLITDNLGNLRSARSFMQMLSVVESDYYMFCDQDDVWLENKIQVSLDRLIEMESVDTSKPCLVFTDLTLVNDKLELIHKSMWEYSNINPDNAKDFYKTTCLSSVTGCTMIFNKELKKYVLPYPKTGRMHDWWISLNATHYGLVEYIKSPSILYRQHGNNVLGAESRSKYHNLKRLKALKTTLNDNIGVLKMLKDLKFKINYFTVFYTKIKTVLSTNK